MLKSTPLFFACLTVLGLHAATYYPITVNYDPGDSVVVEDFPVLLRIPAGSPIYDTAGEFSENLRFTDSLGINCYPHETDTWNPNGESLVWIKLPQLKKDFAFRLYCEGEDTTSASNVWSAYAGVWHLAAEWDSAEKDLGTTRIDGAKITGMIGDGYGQSKADVGPTFVNKVYDNSNGVKKPIQVSTPEVFSVSCWVRIEDAATEWTQLFGETPAQNGNTGWRAQFTRNGGASLRLCQLGGSGNAVVVFNTEGRFSGWTKVDAVWNRKTVALYINSELVGSGDVPNGTSPAWHWTGWMGWGGYVGENGVVPATEIAAGLSFDECRIFDGALDAYRIAADYAVVTNAGFLSLGAGVSEQEVPEGTVAQVGADYYQDLAGAVAASKSSGDPVVLMANGLSWTFTTLNDTVAFKLGDCTFEAVNGLGTGYFVDTVVDQNTGVTTYTLKVQVAVTAMRNVAVYRDILTKLGECLPSQVAGLDADGAVLGMFDVAWDIVDTSPYDRFGVVSVPGVATVGGERLPVTAFVRSTLSYSDNHQDIAQAADSMVVTAPARQGYEAITDVTKITNQGEDSVSLITNGLPASAKIDAWNSDATSAFANWNSNKIHPFVEVDFDWGEPQKVYRVEIIGRGGGSNVEIYSIEIAADGAVVADTKPTANAAGQVKFNGFKTYRYDFAAPLTANRVSVVVEQMADGNVSIQEIMIWGEGRPLDRCEASGSDELVVLEIDGVPVALQPDKTSYTVMGATKVTAAAGEANVAVTVLPSKEGVIRLVTMSEAGSSKTYSIVSGSPGFNIILR